MKRVYTCTLVGGGGRWDLGGERCIHTCIYTCTLYMYIRIHVKEVDVGKWDGGVVGERGKGICIEAWVTVIACAHTIQCMWLYIFIVLYPVHVQYMYIHLTHVQFVYAVFCL